MRRKWKCENCIEHNDSIFRDLPNKDKDLLRNKHACINYRKGEIIFKEGDRPSGLICLSSGQVKLFKEGVGGRDQIIRLATPVNFIGYRAMFANDNYIASAVAIDDSVITVFERDAIFEILSRNANLGIKFIQMFANELGFSSVRTVSLTQKHIRGRLAESIVFLKDKFGLEADEQTIKAYLSRDDLASLSNMTASNAIRTLSAFANEGLIELKGRKIRILDVVQLEKISEQG